MADYVSAVRSNYFKVKSLEAFREFCDEYDLEMVEGEDGLVAFYKEGLNEGIPETRYDEETADIVPVDFCGELAKHLDENYVAVIREIGREKMRYLIGRTIAVHPSGREITVDLDDIYEKVERLWPDKQITDCSY